MKSKRYLKEFKCRITSNIGHLELSDLANE